MRFLLILNLYFVFVSLLKLNDDMEMITDIVQSFEIPTSIVANVCWSSATKVKFIQTLSNLNPPKLTNFINHDDFNTLILVKDDLVILDMNCDDSKRFLSQANRNRMFTKSYRWLILEMTKNEKDTISTEFTDLDVLIDSEVIIARRRNNYDIVLLSIYKTEAKSKWHIECFGTWSIIGHLNKSKEMATSSAMRRKNLNGLSVVISTVISDNKTKNELEDLKYGNIFTDTPTKSSFRIIKPLYYFMNATQQIIYTDKWGYKTNGTWNGMIGHLDSGVADLAGVVSFMTKERLEVLNYLNSPTPFKVAFVFRSPPLSYQNNLFILPFEPLVWYCTFALAILLIFILYLNTKWENIKRNKYNKNDYSTELRPNLSDITILVFSAISQQGFNKELKGGLGRIVIFIIYLIFLFLYTSYSANIVALLQSTSNQINSLSDLLNSKIEVGSEDTVYNRYYFTTSTDPVRKSMYETKMMTKGPTQNFLSLEEGVKTIQIKPFAFNMNTLLGYKLVEKYFHEHEKCGLQEIEYLPFGVPWFCCRKYTPFSEVYKIGLLRIQEHGLNIRENNLVYTKKPVCSGGGGTFGSVNMIDFYPLLLLLTYGVTAAVFILISELITNRRQKLF